MPPGIHSKLGPSKSESWINCPPCLKLTEDMEDESSEYASAGTAAHELAEYKGKKILGLKAGSRPHSDYDSDEMEECTDMYADYLKEQYDQAKLTCPDPVTLFEQHVEMDNYAPGSFGSCDFMLVADKKLHIVDLKYGYIEVQAKKNTQMMMYALGALNLFDCLYDIEEVEMTIFQPRIQNISSWSMSVEELVKWGNEVLKPAAELAAAGEGEFNPGPWCSHNFCKARTTCRARAEQMLELAKLEFKPPALLSDEELAQVMDNAEELSKWCSDVMTFATIQATEHGKSYPGWKIVEGRSVRKFSDTKAVEEAVKNAGYTDDQIYSKSLITLTAFEKLLGKSTFNDLLGTYVTKSTPKLTLARDNDKRHEVSSNAANDFID